MFHIFGAIAEFERQLIRERTQAGLKAARARGRLGGRPTTITEHKLRVAREMLDGGQHTMQQIADTIGVGRATLYRHLDHRRSRTAPSPPTPAPSAPAQPAVATDQATAPTAQQLKLARRHGRAAPKTAKSTGFPRRPWVGLVADRTRWLRETCPTCRASPGARCRDHHARKTRLATTELHFARGWRARRCPTCHAEPGEGCFTPRGRSAARPHSARLHASFGELTRRVIERALSEELSEHLGYPAGQAPPGGAGNSRNRGNPKTLLTDHGPVAIDTPRDRKGRLSPSWSARASGAWPALTRRSSRSTAAG